MFSLTHLTWPVSSIWHISSLPTYWKSSILASRTPHFSLPFHFPRCSFALFFLASLHPSELKPSECLRDQSSDLFFTLNAFGDLIQPGNCKNNLYAKDSNLDFQPRFSLTVQSYMSNCLFSTFTWIWNMRLKSNMSQTAFPAPAPTCSPAVVSTYQEWCHHSSCSQDH